MQCARGRKPLQASKIKGLAAAGAQMPRARDYFADFLHSLAVIFFSLGFKFCCMVLRVANARSLVKDLRRLQLGFVIYNLYNGLQLDLTRITAQLSESGLQKLYTFVMALIATAWRGLVSSYCSIQVWGIL